ncbi:winged helix-turn-helix domain-containing protein [Streptomyces thermolineatus]|uniref:Winged helix-turn-helix domain-containing protein n=1 Tax=Streptomyces thermolineatus TaxID=44033 RepID=A0ABN3L659_9ACTN
MLRVHFTAQDLVRVRIATTADPLWETVNGFQLLRKREAATVFGQWRRLTGPRLSSASSRMLAPLLPAYGYFPDFLTPVLPGGPSLEAAIDAIASTPRRQLRHDLTVLATERRLPPWVSALAAGEVETLHRLGEAFRVCHREAVAPVWSRIRAHVDADRAARGQAFLAGGVEGVLRSLGPAFRWRPPVLEADYPVEQDLHLDGRGLLLQPSFFCWRMPVTFVDGALSPVLVYPVRPGPGWLEDVPGGAPRARDGARDGEAGGGLGPLIGRTRAALLDAVRGGCSTGDLARRLGVSASAVSQHVAVLREAGLLVSSRKAQHVLHTITPEGRALLRAPRRPVEALVPRPPV